jgi:hypothetical protein
MSDQTELLRLLRLAWISDHVTADDCKKIDTLLAATAEDVRAVVDGPLTDEGTIVQVLEPQQQRLFSSRTMLPHPPRHEGFLQPERKVPGYTLDQMKEYGAQCAAEALRQNK